jgi:hypothetical protein
MLRESGRIESPMCSGSGSPVTVAPGRWASSVPLTENPSRSLNTSGECTAPFRGRGSIAADSASRRPVGVPSSTTENTLLGNG